MRLRQLLKLDLVLKRIRFRSARYGAREARAINGRTPIVADVNRLHLPSKQSPSPELEEAVGCSIAPRSCGGQLKPSTKTHLANAAGRSQHLGR